MYTPAGPAGVEVVTSTAEIQQTGMQPLYAVNKVRTFCEPITFISSRAGTPAAAADTGKTHRKLILQRSSSSNADNDNNHHHYHHQHHNHRNHRNRQNNHHRNNQSHRHQPQRHHHHHHHHSQYDEGDSASNENNHRLRQPITLTRAQTEVKDKRPPYVPTYFLEYKDRVWPTMSSEIPARNDYLPREERPPTHKLQPVRPTSRADGGVSGEMPKQGGRGEGDDLISGGVARLNPTTVQNDAARKLKERGGNSQSQSQRQNNNKVSKIPSIVGSNMKIRPTAEVRNDLTHTEPRDYTLLEKNDRLDSVSSSIIAPPSSEGYTTVSAVKFRKAPQKCCCAGE